MIEQDTVRLLRECDSGAKMGITAIDDVMGHVKSEKLRRQLVLHAVGHEIEHASGEAAAEHGPQGIAALLHLLLYFGQVFPNEIIVIDVREFHFQLDHGDHLFLYCSFVVYHAFPVSQVPGLTIPPFD